MYMDNNIYIISSVASFILALISLIFSINFINDFHFQYLVISASLAILFGFLTFMILYYKYPDNIYPGNTNPCPDFWELQMDGTCKINDLNNGSMKKSEQTFFIENGSAYKVRDESDSRIARPNHNVTQKISAYDLNTIPFGYYINEDPDRVDFTDVRWSTYGSNSNRTCALKAWANKNGIIWDGIHNYNQCLT